MGWLPIDSIRARLLAAAAVWLVAALIAAWWVIAGMLTEFITDRFDAEAAAIADTVIAGTEVRDGTVFVGHPPTDPRLSIPLSQWSWQLETAAGMPLARSPSLLDLYLRSPAVAFTGGMGVDTQGEALRVLRRVFTLPDAESPLAVTVTAPQAEIDAAVALVRRPLAAALIVLGAGLAAATVAQVTIGLRSLDRMGRDIRQIRAGQAERMPMPVVAELRPFALEINALLDENHRVIARAREHLGNLAHSLKTPMATLANALPPDHTAQHLIARMDRQIGWHLRRARTAGAPRLLGRWTAVGPVIDDILLVLGHPVRDRALSISVSCPASARFSGERQDLEEMVGNLLENAVKYARKQVDVQARTQGDNLILTVSDDGPGMSDSDYTTALSRGGRLDEMGPPGAGLGLAIVADLAALHGGGVRLDRSGLGGLAATLTLPA